MEKILKSWLESGKITQEEYDAAMAATPNTPDAWRVTREMYERRVADAERARDAALAREKEKDDVIASFADSTGAPPTTETAESAAVKYALDKLKHKKSMNVRY